MPIYALFEPNSGDLEVYTLDDGGRYRRQIVDNDGHYYIATLDLALGAWQGTRENRTGYWLRWWDAAGNLLPWRSELVATERQRADAEKERADAAQLKAERLAAKLQELGIDPSAL